MTPEGHPETEREATLLGLHGPAPRQSFDDGNTLSLVDAADRMGVPVNQVVRWCEDGTVPEGYFLGKARRPKSLRLSTEWVDLWLAHGEVTL